MIGSRRYRLLGDRLLVAVDELGQGPACPSSSMDSIVASWVRGVRSTISSSTTAFLVAAQELAHRGGTADRASAGAVDDGWGPSRSHSRCRFQTPVRPGVCIPVM